MSGSPGKIKKSETEIQNKIRFDLSCDWTRLFRNSTGNFFQGKIVKITGRRVILDNFRRIIAGLGKGTSDLIGWHSIIITPEMVGKRVAIFTAVEVKSQHGRAKPGQLEFLRAVTGHGGIAGIAKSTDDVKNLFDKFLKALSI